MLTRCPYVYSFECYIASSSFESDRFRNFTTSDNESDAETGMLVVPSYTDEELSVAMRKLHNEERQERLKLRKAERQKRNPHKQGREHKSYQDYLDMLLPERL